MTVDPSVSAYSDSSGELHFWSVEPGERRVRVVCEAPAGGVRVWQAVRVLLPRDTAGRARVVVPTGACRGAAPQLTRVVTGRWEAGFVQNSFRLWPDSLALLGPMTLELSVEARASWSRLARRGGGRGPWCLRVRGSLVGPGHFGHMGLGAYEFRAEDLLALVPIDANGRCATPASVPRRERCPGAGDVSRARRVPVRRSGA